MKNVLLFPSLFLSGYVMAQNIGIGTNTPSEKLEVAGTVKASGFKYANPKTGYAIIPAAAFQKQADADNIERYTSGVFYAVPTANPMLAPVSLPQGATITSFKVYFFDNSAVADVTVHLEFYNFLGFTQAIASVSSAGTPGLGSATINTFFAASQVNYLNGYYSVTAYASNSAWPGPDLQVRAVVITYTMNETN